MRTGESARLLGVVGEIGLTMLISVVAYNLNGIFVCSHGSVGPESIKFGLEHAFATKRNFLDLGQGCEGYVIHDSYSKVVLGFRKFKVIIYGDYLGRCGVGRT